MSFSYTAQIATSDRDAVRFELGDTDPNDPLLFDQEIDALLASEGSVIRAAVAGCQAILARLARRTQASVDGVSVARQQQREGYEALLRRLRRRLATQAATVYAGGIAIGDKQTRDDDADRVRPAFTRDRFDLIGGRTDLDGAADDN
jgi:hypothetical protein